MEGMGKQAKMQVNNLSCCKETGFPALRKCISHNNEGKGCDSFGFFFFPSSLLQITLSHGKGKLDFFLTLNMNSEVVTAHKCQCTGKTGSGQHVLDLSVHLQWSKTINILIFCSMFFNCSK